MKTKENRKNKGITLIALVITIIVLLILAGITIGAITSENGIIQNALSAKEQTEIANEREIVEEATVRAMGKNKRGNIVKDELQEELDKITGEGKTIVTEDKEELGYFVKFVDSGRIYKVSIDGDVQYLGKENELITQADIIANPESNTTAELIQQVDLTVKTPIEIEGAEYSLVYAWNQDKENAPEDTKFLEANLIGEGRIRTTTVYSSDTVGGDYYLWVRIVVGEIEREACFGPYAIKDHTTLVSVSWNGGLADGGFLGNNEVQRGKIQNIHIITSLEGHSVDDENTWDVSQSKNGMYLAWYEVNEDGYYDVTIAGNGGVVANSNSIYLFKNIGSGVENQEVTITGLEYLDTGLVTRMDNMFENCKTEELDVSDFNTEKVTSMSSMFVNCSNIESLDVSNFKTENVTSMYQMFNGCSNLTELDLTNFNTSNVTNMALMFQNCSNLKGVNTQSFNTSKVTKMNSMFENCGVDSLNLKNFDTGNVTDMAAMFKNCKATSIDVSSFDTRNVTNMSSMFDSCKVKNLDLSSFDTRNVTNMNMMFRWYGALETLDIRNFDTSKVTNMNSMFAGCANLKELDVSHFDTSNVTVMTSTFSSCSSLTELDVTNFNTSKVSDMNRMFNGCSSLTELDVSHFDTSNVTSMECMFAVCNNLISIDVSNFDTSKVTNMSMLFHACDNLKEANLSSFETTSLSSCNLMFYGCRKLEKIDIRKIEILETCTVYKEMFWYVPTTCNIIVNENMANWMDNNGYSSWNNRTII